MRRSDRWAFFGLGVGVIAILGGVELSGRLDDSPAPLAPVSEFCPDRPTGVARSDTHYRQAAGAYRGNGPHPVDLNLRYAKVGQVEIPDRWKPGSEDTPPRPQLVACVYQDVPAKAHKTDTCIYSRSLNVPVAATKVALFKAEYVFQLFEAKAAKPVGRIQVPGAESCPGTVEVNSRAVFQEPDTKKLRAALRPYVERPVGA
ncbi:hypothetical protein [Actinoallomurus iriomotensis]|uniref:hypothetical protein n=1 Tax=Actinoallomurus iriomotensis TaxID=478107 RepID=UPI0025551ABE|nr:hypothetical protein [Actinoallomurus iriomotensis]